MKVSKPVLIFAIVVLVISGYIFFFTGKKKTTVPAPAVRPASGQAQATPGQTTTPPPLSSVQTSSAQSTMKPNQPEVAPPALKPDFDKLKVGWARNPFVLPQLKEERSKETTPAARLFAILEKGKDRVAIIDHEIVRKGDMVGNEKVLEIESDKVILIRNGVKRVLDLVTFEDQTPEEPKTKAMEKGK